MIDPREPAGETAPDTPFRLTAGIKAAGCAAKISASQLSEIVRALPHLPTANLLTDITSFEDAAVYKITNDLAIIQTIDFFPPVVDDPYLYGRIAAVNALSDVYAMGGSPLFALNVFCFPVCALPLQLASQILQGGAQVLVESGCTLAGGHSIQGAETIYGMAVTGCVHPDRILTNSGAQAGDAVVITKAIGTGVCLLAHKAGVLAQPAAATLLDSLTQLNSRALQIALNYPIHAATDVTGFGLLGHLHEMASSSGLKAQLEAQCVPLLPQGLESAEQGLVPAGAYANRKSYENTTVIHNNVELSLSDLMFDPQTSGGLLFALEEADAEALVRDLKKNGLAAAKIGSFQRGESGHVEVSN